jgi:hypothetical protein
VIRVVHVFELQALDQNNMGCKMLSATWIAETPFPFLQTIQKYSNNKSKNDRIKTMEITILKHSIFKERKIHNFSEDKLCSSLLCQSKGTLSSEPFLHDTPT